jgi:hypothetical protein
LSFECAEGVGCFVRVDGFFLTISSAATDFVSLASVASHSFRIAGGNAGVEGRNAERNLSIVFLKNVSTVNLLSALAEIN